MTATLKKIALEALDVLRTQNDGFILGMWLTGYLTGVGLMVAGRIGGLPLAMPGVIVALVVTVLAPVVGLVLNSKRVQGVAK